MRAYLVVFLYIGMGFKFDLHQERMLQVEDGDARGAIHINS